MKPTEMLKTLVGFPTVSKDTNLPLIDFVDDWLRENGVEAVRILNDVGTKANLYATIGPMVEGGVVLSGHSDVVPIDGQPWDTDPFELTQNEDKLYGRGTCDMKGFSAIALSLVPEMKFLRKPIHIALSYDEEIGCLGAPRLIKQMKEQIPQPAAVIVGEPSMMDTVTAHKGLSAFRTVVTGYEAHSSQTHRGVSAVMNAARLINWLSERDSHFKDSTPINNGFSPHHTTVHAGVVHGGTALNIISRKCEFLWDVRTIPDGPAANVYSEFQEYCNDILLPTMRSVHKGADIQTTALADVPPMREILDNPALKLAQDLTGNTVRSRVAYVAEAGQFQEAGFPTVICGPGSIDQAHQPNEFISINQMEQGEQFLRKLIRRLS
ncbi:MAG TPA: acetylornithine deacetylase [Deltaproteobacteria bacterium]|nr:acetylornithine deacetylase [Deltaproteobacteria bacterium]